MKHFIVQLTYSGTPHEIGAAVEEHRAYLQTGYDQGLLLLSGPQEPRIGGIIVARAESRETLEKFFAKDPFLTLGLASYHYTEFLAVKYQPFLKDWTGN